MQLYTVPGQVFYNETRKLVLKGVDGIVFVADSQKEMLGPNIESFKNLEENLKGHGYKLSEMPHVIQFNKRDLPKLASVEELNAAINKYNAPFYETVATTGIGVQDSLKAITKLVLLHLTKKYDPRTGAAKQPAAKAPAAAAKAPAVKRAPEVQTETTAIPVAGATTTEGSATASTPVQQTAQVPVGAAAGAVGATGSIPLSGSGGGVEAPERPASVGASSVEEEIPISVDRTSVLDETGPDSQGPAPKADFAADEIDGLMGEVEETTEDTSTLAAAATTDEDAETPALETRDVPGDEADEVPEIQLDADTTSGEGAVETPTESETEPETVGDAPRIEVNVEAVPGMERTPEVSEVLSDADLFQDPSLEIAHLAAGQQREIVIPVQIAGEGESFKRYKLSLRLKLDPVD
jgi:hypothetical protein